MLLSRSFAFIGFALLAPGDAFVPPSGVVPPSKLPLGAASGPSDERSATSVVIRNIAAASVLTLGLLFPSADAFADQSTVSRLPSVDHTLHSSTVELSAEIKTMDFSLPSSYDTIADPVASGSDELTNLEVINTAASKRKSKEAPKKSNPATSSSGLSLSLPSSPNLKDAAASSAAAQAERVAQRQADEAEKAARAEQAAKELDAKIKAARMEKIAARQAALAEKEESSSAAKQDGFRGMKFVDTSMPSY